MSYNLLINDTPVRAFNLTGTQTKRVMGENVVDISFSAPGYINILIGTKITVLGEDYILNTLPTVKKLADNRYDYDLHLESVSYELINVICHSLDQNNEPLVPEFPLMGNADTFLDLVIANANRHSSGWTKGVVIESDYKNLQFKDETCLQVLNRIAIEYETEFYIQGKTIHLAKLGSNSGITLQYGLNNGLYDITRTSVDDKSIVTKLFAYGSDQNLPADYRGNPFNKRLRLPVAVGNFIEKNTGIYGKIEGVKTFDIYPKYDGVISSVGNDEFTFSDAAINFDVESYLLPGTDRPAKIVFNTGLLAGYEFSVDSYNHTTKTFKINKNDDEELFDIPSPQLKPAIGDKYKIIGIYLPAEYIEAAETKLHQKSLEYLDQNADPHVKYSVTADPLYFEREGITIGLGDYVHIIDADIDIDKDIRVVGFVRDINNPYQYTSIDLADTISVSSIVRQFNENLTIQKAVRAHKLTDINRSRRSWRAQQEAIDMMFDPETGLIRNDKLDVGFINSLVITSRSSIQNFLLDVIFDPTYQGDANSLAWTSGTLTHREIFEHQNGIWTFDSGFVVNLDPAKAYYIYLDAPFGSNVGDIFISDTIFAYNVVPNKYRYLLGILSSVIDGFRTVEDTHGSTTINLGQIKSGRLKNQLGELVLDLDTRKFYGDFEFSDGRNVELVVDSALSNASEAKNFIDNVLPGTLAEIQSQLDGVQVNWFYNYDPTMVNYPASSWTDNATKEEHLGDAFYNDSTGKAWRFSKDINGVYYWKEITDTDASAALALAQQAKDTADGKRRVFVIQPAPPYDVGDLWVQGTAGDLMRCLVARASGTFSSSDWVKAVKYTDDAVANQAIANALSASNAATAAQNSANTANTTLSGLANDDLLTPLEKQATLKEWQIIQGEKPTVIAQAQTYGVSYSTYDSAYNTLSGYIVPLLSNISTNSAIVGSTFRSTFKAYYDAKVDLLKQVSDAAATFASSVATAAQNAAAADATNKANAARNAAEAYAASQAAFERENAKAYADGVVTSEEQARINQAAANLQAAKDDATAKANAAEAAASALAAAAQQAANNAQGTANDAITAHNNLVASLKSMAFQDVVEFAKLGTTIIEGGYIKTTLLNADYIRASIINASYINTLDIVATNIQANTGNIGGWQIDSAGIVDTSGAAKITFDRTFAVGGKLEASVGSSVTSLNVNTQIGSEAIAASFKSTRNYANGINVAIRAEASGGIGGGKAGDFIGNVAVSETLSARKTILTNSLNIALDVNGRVIFNGLPHTNTLAGYTTLVRRNTDGWIFTYG